MQIKLPPGNIFPRARAGGASGAAERNNFFCRILGQKFIIKRFLHSAALVFCLPLIGWAQTFLKPGDTGSIEFPIENDSDSVAAAEGVEITVAAPAYFIVKNTSILGPVSENPAENKIFVVNYEIGQDAPDGSFSANLSLKATTKKITPSPDTVSASVDFTIDHTAPQVTVGLYGPVGGIMNVVSPPLNTQIPAITINDVTGGISTVDLIYYPPGSPGGIILASKEYMIPVKYYFQQMQLEEGNYTLAVQDAAGNITTVSFYIPPLNLALNVHLDGSILSVNGMETNKFTVGIKADVQANFGLRDVTIADNKGTPIVSQSITGAEASVSLNMPGDFSVYNSSSPQHKYSMYVCDQESHCKTRSFVFMYKRAESYADQIQVGQGMGPFVVLTTSSFQTPVIDLTGDGRLIGGGVMPVYIDPAKPDWWQDGSSYHYASYGAALQNVPWGDREQVGHIKVTVRTWNNPDKSDIEVRVVSDRETFLANSGEVLGAVCPGEADGEVNNGYCYIEAAAQNRFVAVKRYVQTEITFTKTPRTTLLTPRGWQRFPMSSQVGYDLKPGAVIAGPQIYGFTMTLNPGEAKGKPIPTGPIVDVPLSDGTGMQIANSRDGSVLDAYQTPVSAPAGLNNPNGLGGWHLEISEPNFDQASVKMSYNSSNVPSTKELKLQVFEKKANGTFNALPTVVDTVNKEVSAVVGPVSDLLVAYPAYDNPVSVVSAIVIDGNPEMTFTSEDPTITQSVYDTSSQGGQSLLSLIAANGGILASKVYQLGPENLALKPYGAISMRYNRADLAAAGIQDESTLDIYGFSLDGSSVSVISNSLVNTASSEVLAEVRRLYPLFAVVGSSKVPPTLDITPPVSTLVSTFGYTAANKTYIPQRGFLEIVAVDQNTAGAPVSGAASSYYLIDAVPGTVTPIVYAGPFTLPEGIHSLTYRSGDNAGSMEAWNTQIFYVDGNSPETQIAIQNSTAPMIGTVYITEQDSITLTAIDPISNGVTSGLRNRYFLIDINPESCQSEPAFTGPVGTCQNPRYSETFTLPIGTHTVYYTADDNVGNMAIGKSAYITVAAVNSSLDTVPPVVTASVNGQVLADGGSVSMTPADTVTLASTDDITALPVIYYTIDTPFSQAASSTTYAAPFTLEAGPHTVYYTAVDNAGNTAAIKSAVLTVLSPAGFTVTGSMLTQRIIHTETLLPDGQVLITGGRNPSGYLSSAELYDPVAKTFTATGSMNIARAYHTATLLPNGKVLITGGFNGSTSLSSAELYDPITKTFSFTTGSMLAERDAHTATLLLNGKVLIAGGENEKGTTHASAEIYDPVTGTFSFTAGPMNAKREQYAATLLSDGKVLMIGGWNGSAPLSSVDVYDPGSGTFSSTGSMSVERWRHAATLLANGKVLVIGGVANGNAYLSSVELYDPGTGTFTPAGSVSSVMSGPTLTLLANGKVLVAGGNDGNLTLSSAELYDPSVGAFSAAGMMSAARVGHAAVLLADGRVLVSGGVNGGGYLSSAELYSPEINAPVNTVMTAIAVTPSSAMVAVGGTQQFTATGNFSDGSSRALGTSDGLTWSVAPGMVATVSPNGLATGVADGTARIMVSSGIISAEASLVVGVIPPAAGFTVTGSMLTQRIIHAETLLPDGQVLITGGRNPSGYLSSAELYDPVAKTFIATGSMKIARAFHTATLLPNGKVLITGGFNGSTSLSSAELYDPITKTFSFTTGSMLAERDAHTATLLLNGKVLIAGGENEKGTTHASAEIYDPVTGRFSFTAGPMNAKREQYAATLLSDGKVLMIGGWNGGAPVASVDLYDPGSGTFSSTGSMNVERWRHAATLLANGKVLVVGGVANGNVYLSSVELYDPGTGTFTPTGSVSSAMSGPTLTLLANGKVLVAGGNDGNLTLSSAELYDPSVGAFSAAGMMSAARVGHAAVLLADGRVLVSGGVNGGGYLSSAELYGPGINSPLTMTASPETITQAHDYTTAEYVLPEAGFVTLEVLSSTAPYGRLRTIHSEVFQAAGLRSAQWDGKGANAAVLGDGAYILRLMVVGVMGNFSASADRTVHIDNYPQISSMTAKPESFNPSSGERTRFVFGVSEDVLLNITVKDANGGSIKNLAVNTLSPAGSLSFYWNGRDNLEQVVPPGIYHLTVNAVDRTGNSSDASGGNCEVLSSAYPAITGLTETPDPFYPGSANPSLNKVVFSYNLTAVSQTSTVFPVAVVIRHPVMGIVKTITFDQAQGNKTVDWDGLSDPGTVLNGQPAPDGAYSEEVSVNVDGQIASAYGAFSLLRNNVYSAESSASNPMVTVQYDAQAAQITITQDPPVTSTVSAALLSQTLSGNVLASPIFDIVASQAFTTQPVLRFKYDPVFDGESLALYKYSVLSGTWIQVSTSYTVDIANNEIIVTLNPDVFMGSLFALMKTDDAVAPITEPIFTGSQYSSSGNLYVSGRTSIAFRSHDLGGSGVAYTQYRADGGAFAAYNAPFTMPAGAHVIEYRSADKAGNMEQAKILNITVDNAAPVSAVSLAGILGVNGWYLSGVDAAISATDGQAGLKETLYRLDSSSFAVYSSSFAVLSEGRHTLEVYSIDNVSNVEISTAVNVDIDTTAPVSTAAISGAYNNGWYSAAVTVVLASTDTVSGIKESMWSIDGGGFAVYTQPVVVSSEGKHVLRYYAEDIAGNKEPLRTIEFGINTSAPVVDYLLEPLPNAGGWNNGPVNVLFRGSDTLSGIEECSSMTVTTEGKDQKIAGWCRDLAGNIGYSTATLNIDRTEPGIIISSPVAGALFIAGKDKIEIQLSSVDNLDPSPSVTAVLTQTEDKGTPRGTRPGSIIVTNGQLIDPSDMDDGLWRLEVSAKDIAGNSTQAVSGLFAVTHDTMPPQTSLSVGAPNSVYGGTRFITSYTPLLFSATDDMLIAGDRSGAGVAATYVYLDGRSIDVLSGALFVAGESTHTVNYFSLDRASNTEAAHSAVFTVDNSSPVSVIAFSGTAAAGADGGYSIPSGSSVSFTAADLPAGAASGVSSIWYSVNSGTPSAFDSAFGLAVGSYTISYWSIDTLGNTEARKTTLVSVAAGDALTVKLELEPSTLNLNSKGEAVTAKLRFEGSGQACFRLKTIKINAVNGRELGKPIYALNPKGEHNDDHGKGGRDDGDKEHGSGDAGSQCGSITVKFDRDALIAVLPPSAVSNVAVSGELTDGRGFSASDTIRTIKPHKTSCRDGGRYEHQKHAGFDAPARALKGDDDLYVLSVEGDLGSRESRKDAAAKKRGIARRGSAYEFGPEGEVFDKPVTISLPYDADEKASEKLAIAYWNDAAGLWEILPSRRDIAGRLIKTEVPHFSQYQVVLASYSVSSLEPAKRVRASELGESSVSAADTEFKLGEVYVYPNPAKGGKVPTFHVEVGIADTIKIRVYTVAGQLVHERVLAGDPQIVGTAYAYEYAWAGRIASGVYYYNVEAEKAGKKLKGKGKFAVIR